MAFNITGRFIKIWEVDVKEKMVLCDLSTSEKNKDGEWEASNYYKVKFVGKCFENAKTLKKGDTIEIINGKIGKRKYQEKYYDDVVVFAYRMEEGQKQYEPSGFKPVDSEQDLPF